MTKDRIAWAVVAALIVIAAIVWRDSDPTGEADGQVGADDPDQALVESMLERTRRESRTGVEEPISEAPPDAPGLLGAARQADGSRRDGSEPEAAAPESGLDSDLLPEGYTLGAYRGAMQRAPLTNAPEPELSPNPAWLEPGPAPDEILDQAARSGRGFTFAVLRVLPGTDLQALNSALAALGARIEGSTGPYVRIRVPAERSSLEAIAGLDDVLGIGAVPPELKADEAFVQEMLARPASEPVPVYITLMAEDIAGEWRQALTALGVVVGAYDRGLRSYTANLTPAALAPTLEADFVLSVEPVPVVTTAHASSVPVMGVDGFRQYDPATESFSGITGSGIAVGVIDTGLNASHADIVHGRASICGANFVTSFGANEIWDLWVDAMGHGTHVVGTIAGAGRVDPVFAGIAPGASHLRLAKVLTRWGGGGFGDDIRRGMDYLARPTSCDWRGTQSEAIKPLIVNMSLAATSLTFSGRGVGERKLDSIVHGHSQLYVVAQANSGLHGFSNYGTAKNSLAVGAVEDSGIIATFSSHGPTADGRLAPNVVATGRRLTSARGRASVSGYETRSGTSMAAPSVAGVAALLMEARPEFQNQPALTRARLMASAIRPRAYFETPTQLPSDNTDGPGAFNSLYGLGLVSARTTLFSRDDKEGWTIGSATAQPDGDSYEYVDIAVPEGASRLDIVLTWDEQPADTLTRSVLNNLDLWADQGADCAGDACGEHSSRSDIDNVEWLMIEDPVPGTYRIKVVPVEIYGESSTAAVAWKILRGDPEPLLQVEIEDKSASDNSEYVSIEVAVDASSYVASGTTIFLSCLDDADCTTISGAYQSRRTRAYREDGLQWADPTFSSTAMAIGEVAAGTPRRVQFQFRRARVAPGTTLHIVASSWNAGSSTHGLTLGRNETGSDGRVLAPANDDFSASEQIEGASGLTRVDLALASREPGEPLVSGNSSTLWYTWEAPASGLFRFRLQDADSGEPVNADFALFRGASVVDLEIQVEKTGNEISWAAQQGAVYRLRIASESWDPGRMSLTWESADSRPTNDDFAYAQLIVGESGSIESTNEGATLESTEFPGGAAATVWYEWTAPADGWWRFQTPGSRLRTHVFTGEQLGELRLVSVPDAVATFRARAGETYRIAVFSRSADDSGSRFTLSWNSESRPLGQFGDNDPFDAAIEIAGAEGLVDEVVLRDGMIWIYYTVEPGEPVATGIGTGWWRWTAPADGRYTWRMDGTSAYQLSFFSGDTLENLTFLGALSGGATFVLDATADTSYRIAFGRSPEYIGDQLWPPSAFTWGPTPANDERAAATQIAGVAGLAGAQLTYATRASNDPVDTVGTDSVWLQWRAPTSGWQRFWVEDHPLSTILAVYPNDASNRATADSERTFYANGRVELRVLARAGQSYDIRLSSRPTVGKDRAITLRWEASDAPIALAYKGAAEIDPLETNSLSQGFRSPRNLAMSGDGHYLFGTTKGGVVAFVRDDATGDLALAHHAPAWPGENPANTDRLHQAFLWWNSDHDRLLAHPVGRSYSFALPDDGSRLLARNEIGVRPDDFVFVGSAYPGVGSPDGRHFYAARRSDERLRVYRFDSPTMLTLVQSVSSQYEAGNDALVVPDIGRAVDMTFSPDGLYLYLLTDSKLLVFTRDALSGELELAREIQSNTGPDNPLGELQDLRNVSLGGDGNMLFVSGEPTAIFFSLRAAIAAFDISADPANPAYLDTTSDLFYQNNQDTVFVPTHISTSGGFSQCWNLVPHTGAQAVDVFCARGFYVVAWNAATKALEVTDFAVFGSEDRFGNTLPYHLGGGWLDVRQMAHSPDGAHVYKATSLENNEYSDAIHIFERANAMTPVDSGEDAGDVATEPVEPVEPGEPMEPTEPDEPTGGGNEATPDPVPAADCYVGLLVGIGERCTYPGTTDEFSVNVRGRASFLGRLAGIRIRITNETINGRVYNFEARHQGEGVWRINVVGESM